MSRKYRKGEWRFRLEHGTEGRGRVDKKGRQERDWLNPSDRNNAVFDGILEQFSACLKVQFLHHFIFVEFDGSGRDAEDVADLLGRVALGQQLQNFALPGRQLANAFISKMFTFLIRM